MKKYLFIIALLFLFAPKAHAAVFYIDYTNGADGNSGTATTSSWQGLTKCLGSARSPGDICFVRRGQASTTVLNITITSSGTATNTIAVSADDDNLWNDNATSSQTGTFIVGSKIVTLSGSDGAIVASTTIYVMGDCAETYNALVRNQCPYYYLVKSVSGSVVTLWTPYKGLNAGSGKTVRVLKTIPQWGTTGANANITGSTIYHWVFQGLDLRGNKVGNTGVVTSSTDGGDWSFFDDVITHGSTAGGWPFQCAVNSLFFQKTILWQDSANTTTMVVNCAGEMRIMDSFFQYLGSGVGNTLFNSFGGVIRIYGTEFDPGSAAASAVDTLGAGQSIICRDCYLDRGIWSSVEGDVMYSPNTTAFYLENSQMSTTSQSVIYPWSNDSNKQQVIFSTSSPTLLRAGGGTSIEGIHPTSFTASTSPLREIQLFEYPIYSNTTAKTYTVYFMSSSTAAWSVNPLSTELFIECSYLGTNTASASSTMLSRQSTGTVNFTGSTAWQSLSVTCTPTGTGLLYLRAWYGKAKEATGKQNEFFVDTQPLIQ